jgi:hypothetical protein
MMWQCRCERRVPLPLLPQQASATSGPAATGQRLPLQQRRQLLMLETTLSQRAPTHQRRPHWLRLLSTRLRVRCRNSQLPRQGLLRMRWGSLRCTV